MSPSADFPISWEYPSTGPAPPSPVLVSTDSEYTSGGPTPPLTPSRPCATRIVDDYACCPPSPRCTAVKDELGPRLFSSRCWPEDQSTTFVDPLMAQYDVTLHASDCHIRVPEEYAHPNPILIMIARAAFDLRGLENRPVNPWTCGKPSKMFSLTAGHIPTTGLENNDEQTFDYYNLLSPAFPHECPISYYFSVGTVQALQHDIRNQWLAVYPQPIPPIIIRSEDLIGPYNLHPSSNGCGYVMPTKDIWDIIRQRGIDYAFRPISPSATVETDVCHTGAARYSPQHVVASKFAVNVFLELSNPKGSLPLCEYLGAYVLQVVEGLNIWTDMKPEIQRALSGGAKHPWPRLPYVFFHYYQWDHCFVRLANEFRNRYIPQRVQAQCETASGSTNSDGDDSSRSSDSTLDTDHSSDEDIACASSYILRRVPAQFGTETRNIDSDDDDDSRSSDSTPDTDHSDDEDTFSISSELRDRCILRRVRVEYETETESVDSDSTLDFNDNDDDSAASSSNESSLEPDYTNFLDFSSCE